MLFVGVLPFKGIISKRLKRLRLNPNDSSCKYLFPTTDLSLTYRRLATGNPLHVSQENRWCSGLVSTLVDACLTVSCSLRVSTPLLTCTQLKEICYTDRSEHPAFASSNGSNRQWLATLECTSEDCGVVASVLASTYPAFLPRQLTSQTGLYKWKNSGGVRRS